MELSKEDRIRILEAIAPTLAAHSGRLDTSPTVWARRMPEAMTDLFKLACDLVSGSKQS